MSIGSMPCSATAATVLRVVADVQNAAMHLGMQRLHSSVEHLGKAGQLGDVLHRDTGVAQQLCGASGGNQFHAQASELTREVDQPGFVGDA